MDALYPAQANNKLVGQAFVSACCCSRYWPSSLRQDRRSVPGRKDGRPRPRLRNAMPCRWLCLPLPLKIS